MDTSPKLSGYLSVTEAAQLLGVHIKTIYDAIKRKPGERGFLPAVRIGRSVRIARSAIEALSLTDD